MSKTEVISFRDFMDGSYSRKPDLQKPRLVYSIAPLVPPNLFQTMFFNEFTIVVLGIGAVLIGFALLERMLAKNHEDVAETISMMVSIIIPLIACGLGFFLISKCATLFL